MGGARRAGGRGERIDCSVFHSATFRQPPRVEWLLRRVLSAERRTAPRDNPRMIAVSIAVLPVCSSSLTTGGFEFSYFAYTAKYRNVLERTVLCFIFAMIAADIFYFFATNHRGLKKKVLSNQTCIYIYRPRCF